MDAMPALGQAIRREAGVGFSRSDHLGYVAPHYDTSRGGGV